ncbi:HesB/YadR/YfhF family protein [Fervidibacillus halotolerans]|uniref:HesB/YadR/YfhF family protein n=1 Tax=Fervidibacillus halotolerans TaxID=2980027 RepID=A0A9E8RXU3_9BACI|nr:HesB/YadR/YfhF family protein [Fervidibacillus halotolerans]WAA13110.1 HesB/YadR/YfhF family protein [Fervidibacillus halotolerans]
MKLNLSPAAIQWFKNEMELQKGDMVKFFIQIYGSSPVQKGYSLGFTKDNEPIDIGVQYEADGIVFYVEESDLWFFDGHHLNVDYNEEKDELEYTYEGVSPQKR